jgi:uncharacterized protein (TIGR03086 family)
MVSDGAVHPGEFDGRVLDSIDHILGQVTPAHLGRATPCTGWDLDTLLRHMIGHHRGFAASARGERSGADLWDGATLGNDPAATYRAAAAEVKAAFAADGPLDRKLYVFGYGNFPAGAAMNMHSVDFLAHGWDVAKAIGVDDTLDEQLCMIGLDIAAGWPDTPATWGPNGAFQNRVAVAASRPAYQRLMGFLGRDPGWRPA